MAGDDGFREIHLNGKQLVFLFMAITVVAAVIFLCGVMVGRGVCNSTAASAAVEPAPASGVTGDVLPPSDAQAQAKPAPPPALPATPPPIPAEEAAPQPAAADSARAGEPAKKAEPAKKGTPAVPPAQAPAAPAAAPKLEETRAAGAGEPAGDGWMVQVTALTDYAQAEAIVKRLVAKGYAAYLLGPPPGGTALYRVRVGKFKERREADTVRRRLEKEEQFKNCFTTR